MAKLAVEAKGTAYKCPTLQGAMSMRTAHRRSQPVRRWIATALASRRAPTKVEHRDLDTVSTAPVSFLGHEDDVDGQIMFLHLRQGVTVGQVVAMCNELAGRVPNGGRQRVSGHTRPVSFVLPSGRVDWDPMTEELPLAVGQLLGAECAALRLWDVSVCVEGSVQLGALRRHLGDTVEYIQHNSCQRNALSASF